MQTQCHYLEVSEEMHKTLLQLVQGKMQTQCHYLEEVSEEIIIIS